jgi:hypothetical protein
MRMKVSRREQKSLRSIKEKVDSAHESEQERAGESGGHEEEAGL